MTGLARILCVGFDACDPETALDLAAAGRMPFLAQLMKTAARCPLRHPFGLFVGALWTTFATGLRPDRHGFYCWDEIDVASYRRRLVSPGRAKGTPFWRALSAAGKRTAVIDVPHSRADPPIHGLHIAEWGCHDRHFGFHTWPREEAARIEKVFGLHPLLGVDAYSTREFAPDDYVFRVGARRTPVEEQQLFNGLLSGLERKRRLSASLLAEGGWDLFVTVFGESHAIGHQQWHLHDRANPRFDAAALQAVGGDPVAAVYERLDSAFGELLSLVDGETTVLLLLSHGMGSHVGGTHLLDEILRRLDFAWEGGPLRGRPGDVMDRAMVKLFGGAGLRRRGLALPEVLELAARRLPRASREFVFRWERARQRFFLEPNHSVYGGVRLNLVGREPRGRVRREDAGEIVARLTRDLCEVIDLDSGRPAIRAVEPAERWYRRSDEDSIPDLFVEWERAGSVKTVWSPKIGILHAPYTNWRSGDHRPGGLMFAAGPGMPAGALLPEIELEDIAPSLAARLDVALDDIDGRPVGRLSGRGLD